VAHTLKYCPKNKDGLEDVLSINTLKSMRSSTGIRRNLQAGNSSVTSYPPPQYQVSRIHGRRQLGKLQGPNAAWTGITTQPVITPMFGDIINSQNRERKFGYPPTM
jgi:hypothetical protein